MNMIKKDVLLYLDKQQILNQISLIISLINHLDK